MRQEIEEYVRSLGLDAYVVGGAVRDELLGLDSKDADFLVPGLDTEGLRAALAPHGRVEDLVVADRLVGVRLHPRDGRIRKLTPAGIEFAPPRKEVSTGPGRHDFEIVADASLSVEDDMRRRDFTVNAMARRLDTGELVDPLGGRADLEARRLRTVSPQSFREDPLRLVRALRFVSQLGFEPDAELLEQMREETPAVKLVSGERIGGGLAADGMGELSKLLLGAEPARALRLARDTGVLVELLPEFGPRSDSTRRAGTTTSRSTSTRSRSCRPQPTRASRCRCGSPRSSTTSASRSSAGVGTTDGSTTTRSPASPPTGTTRSARTSPRRRCSGSAIRTRSGGTSSGSCAVTCSSREGRRPPGAAVSAAERRRARVRPHRPQARGPARQARQRRGPPPLEEIERLAAFRAVVEQELSSPHRLRDLAVDGNDLIALGFEPGPQLGRILHDLLDAVVDEPALNTRDQLLPRAKERL